MSLPTIELARATLNKLKANEGKIVTAESCTSGLLAATLTLHPGSSEVFLGGLLTYSNEAKHQLLGVPEPCLAEFGAVSQQTAIAMAEGALKQFPGANIAVSITGIAGPGGGSPEKPVGTIWIALAQKGARTLARNHLFQGDRSEVRAQTVHAALLHINEIV